MLDPNRPMASTWHAIYFVYSFSYLVLRTMAVSLYAAAIYDQSKQPKAVLYSVPSESYCTEVSFLQSCTVFKGWFSRGAPIRMGKKVKKWLFSPEKRRSGNFSLKKLMNKKSKVIKHQV